MMSELPSWPQIGDEKKAASLGITVLPSLVYYEDNIPNIYKGDLRIERDVLDWLVEQLNNDEIEEVTDEILDKLIEKHPTLIAVFCKKSQLKLFQRQKHSPPCLMSLSFSLFPVQ